MGFLSIVLRSVPVARLLLVIDHMFFGSARLLRQYVLRFVKAAHQLMLVSSWNVSMFG
jgi:hypothetical protein